MKTHTAIIHTRFSYDPRTIPEHGTPLFDRKGARPIKPTATVRVGASYFTPKQIVYILNHPSARPTPDTPNPYITIPPYILPKDGDPDNILFENLKASNTSGRWAKHHKYVETENGALIPKHLIAAMGKDDRERFGLTIEE
jgi:hypothetical protein